MATSALLITSLCSLRSSLLPRFSPKFPSSSSSSSSSSPSYFLRFNRFRSFASSSSSMAGSSEPKESPSNNPGLRSEVDEATKGYFLQQTVSPVILFCHFVSWVLTESDVELNCWVLFFHCRCLELRILKRALISTLECWACRKSPLISLLSP